jgi:hypothetical protein
MGYLGSKPILAAARAMREKYPLQQFGQPYDSKWHDGATACAGTSWQFILRFWKNKHYTLDQVAVLAGYPTREQWANWGGLQPTQIQRLIYKAKLPYKLIVNPTWATVSQATNLGPVFVPTMYSHWPEWRGAPYTGRFDGRPNGYAIKGGKTQATFSGRHATVYLGYLPWDDSDADTTVDAYHAFVMEPNHNSASRPEDPPYDIITTTQYRIAFEQYKANTGSTYIFVPTRSWTKP